MNADVHIRGHGVYEFPFAAPHPGSHSNVQQYAFSSCHLKTLIHRPGATRPRRLAISKDQKVGHLVSAHCTANTFADLLSQPNSIKIIVPNCQILSRDSLGTGRKRPSLHTIQYHSPLHLVEQNPGQTRSMDLWLDWGFWRYPLDRGHNVN